MIENFDSMKHEHHFRSALNQLIVDWPSASTPCGQNSDLMQVPSIWLSGSVVVVVLLLLLLLVLLVVLLVLVLPRWS